MRGRNTLFIAAEKKLHVLGGRWAAWMAKREMRVNRKKKKMYLYFFTGIMILLLWLPFFLQKNQPIINIGNIKPPVELNRNAYAVQKRFLDQLIDSLHNHSSKLDSVKKQYILQKDTLKNK